MRQIAAIILAAGRSERMGAFKPLLPFGPTTVIESCINYLRAASIEDIVVVAGYRADDLQDALKDLMVKVVINSLPNSEMNSSIACGIHSLPSHAQATLISLCDHPAVSSDVVQSLISHWEEGALILKPTWNDKGGHPVLVDLQFRKELASLDPKEGLKGLFRKHNDLVTRVPVSSPYVARDMDTWDDYLTLHTEVFGKQPTAGGA